MLQFKPVKTNPDRYAIISEADGKREGTLIYDIFSGEWELGNIYRCGFGVKSLKAIRRKLKELNNARV